MNWRKTVQLQLFQIAPWPGIGLLHCSSTDLVGFLHTNRGIKPGQNKCVLHVQKWGGWEGKPIRNLETIQGQDLASYTSNHAISPHAILFQ